MILSPLAKIGTYTMLMGKVFRKPKKWSVFFNQFLDEIRKLGIDSIWIVLVISFLLEQLLLFK